MKCIYLELDQILAIHDTLIEEIGGSMGLRDAGLLESAAYQPRQSFGGEDLYPDIFSKAAAYAFSISENQPFIDGNKRTAATIAAVFLDINGFLLDCPEGQVYETMMKLANKQLTRESLADWFRKNCKKKSAKKAASGKKTPSKKSK
ncbi:MAG: type II toxin-antitoxin system death-on-curing family toxin [Deltaproteobacteria bacterium]|nr:type II toxin-antitoxin system death-on-curing family toxin [Deltaproteobacteria bacterium]